MARKRPEGVTEIKGRWYWRPPTRAGRRERAELGLPEREPLGPAGSYEACKKWAELSGYRAPEETAASGTVAAILLGFKARGLDKKPNGKPRKPKTIKEYTRAIDKVLLPRFGSMRYGRTNLEASRGQAIGPVNVQRFIRDLGNVAANRHVACLSAAFRWAIGEGLTIFNPCLGVARNAEEPREREALPWEWECIRAVADTLRSPLMGLIMDFAANNGWRLGDILDLRDKQLTAEGIRLKQGKRGRRQRFGWSDENRRIIGEALKLPGAPANRFPLTPVFPSRRGTPLKVDGFETNWSRLVKRTNELLAECDIPLVIEDLHFHDCRSKAGDDAADEGFSIAEFLGNDPSVARRHYARREREVLPIDELRKRKKGAA